MTKRLALVVAPICDDSSSKWYSPGRSAKLGQVERLLSKAGYDLIWINTCPVPAYGHTKKVIQPSKNSSSILRIADFFSSDLGIASINNPDLLWVYNSRVPEAIIVARLLNRNVIKRIIVELEDLPAARQENASWRGRLDLISTQWLLSRSSYVTCLNQPFADALARLVSFSSEKIRYFPPLLDDAFLSIVSARRLAPCSRKRIRIMYAGGYSAEKGVNDLLWAFERLPESKYSLHLIGPATPEIIAWARNRRNAYIHGVIAKERLYQCYCSADVVVNPHLPIHNSSYIFPFKIIEQLSSGAVPLLSVHFVTKELQVPRDLVFSGKHELYERLLAIMQTRASLGCIQDELAVRIRELYGFRTVGIRLEEMFTP